MVTKFVGEGANIGRINPCFVLEAHEIKMIKDMTTTSGTLDGLTRRIQSRVKRGSTAAQRTAPYLLDILRHPNFDFDVMKTMLDFVAKNDLAYTRPILDEIKFNNTAISFLPSLYKLADSIDPTDPTGDKRAFGISVVAKLIIDEIELKENDKNDMLRQSISESKVMLDQIRCGRPCL